MPSRRPPAGKSPATTRAMLFRLPVTSFSRGPEVRHAEPPPRMSVVARHGRLVPRAGKRLARNAHPQPGRIHPCRAHAEPAAIRLSRLRANSRRSARHAAQQFSHSLAAVEPAFSIKMALEQIEHASIYVACR